MFRLPLLGFAVRELYTDRVSCLPAMGDPEATIIGEINYCRGFSRECFPHRIKGMGPTGGSEVLQDFSAIRKMHERASRAGFFEIAIAELDETRILFLAVPPRSLKSPQGALRRRTIAIVGGEEQGRTWHTDAMQLPQGHSPILPTRDLHHSVEHEQGAPEMLSWKRVGLFAPVRRGGRKGFIEARGVGMVKPNGFDAAFRREAVCLEQEFFCEIERSEISIAQIPQAQRHSTCAATRFNQWSGKVCEIAIDENPFRLPKTERVRSAGVVHHRHEVVEILAHGERRYFGLGRRSGH
jgi:hypothetical protein